MSHSFLAGLFGARSEPGLEHLGFVLYTRPGCHLCELAWDRLRKEQARYRFRVSLVNVDADTALAARYGERVPVVTVNGKQRFSGGVNGVLLTRLLVAEANRRGRQR
ncbi:MAG TPA: glutaredoxin family protein [Gemmataceae bacterium]|jgi:hypothetical protein|nr:glutaredoxin family protein [Gemmataceae bacterium]